MVNENATEQTRGELAALETFATNDLVLSSEDDDKYLQDAAVLKGNALGIIYDGDGSSTSEKVQRMLMLVPALLTVVDEARDTISRLRDVADGHSRLFISAPRSDIERALESVDAPLSSGELTWHIEEIHAGMCEVACVHARSADPRSSDLRSADSGSTARGEPAPAAAPDLMYVLSELKTLLETGEPMRKSEFV